MGLGDELMALGQARRLVEREKLRGKVEIVDINGNRRSHYLWQQAAEVAKVGEPAAARIVHSGGCRPYVDYERTTPDRWAWNDEHRPAPGKLYGITPDARARGLIVIEPEIKRSASVNKQWGAWQSLVDAEPSLPWAQVGTHSTQWLRRVRRLPARTFEDACRLLAASRCAILPEGGLHHAAAALGTRAVVLFGAYIPPEVTGYDFQVNVAVSDAEATGWRTENSRCRAAWETITARTVMDRMASAGWI